MMSLQADALAVVWVGTSVALFFLLIRLFAGWLTGQGSLGDSVGTALLNIFP